VGAGSPLSPHITHCGLGRGLPLYSVTCHLAEVTLDGLRRMAPMQNIPLVQHSPSAFLSDSNSLTNDLLFQSFPTIAYTFGTR